jgi:putative addiction module component (TIGR02574 family)
MYELGKIILGEPAMLNYETILTDASRLPVVDRLQLIEALWDTLPADPLPPLSDEWLAEIQRRSVEFDSGSVPATPWKEIRNEAFHRIGLQG